MLAEDAAGREDGVDGVDDDTRWREGEVAGVVLGWVLESGEKGDGGGETYDGDHAVWLEEGVKVLQELDSEERDGLGASRKDVVDDVVEAGFCLVGGEARSIGDGVLDDGRVVAGELEVLGGELMDDWVELHHRGVDAVGY